MTLQDDIPIPLGHVLYFDTLDPTARRIAVKQLEHLMDDPELASRVKALPLPIDRENLPAATRKRMKRAEKAGYTVPEAVQWRLNPGGAAELLFPEGGPNVGLSRKLPLVDSRELKNVALVLGFISMLALGAAAHVEPLPFSSIDDAAAWAILRVVLIVDLVAAGVVAAGTVVHLRQPTLTAADTALLKQRKLAQAVHGDNEEPLVLAAEYLMSTLTTSRAWTSRYLDTDRATFDPVGELTDIRDQARRIRQVRAQIGEPIKGDTAERRAAADAQRSDRYDLAVIAGSLYSRVAALWHYTTVVTELSDKIAALDVIEQSLTTTGPSLAALAAQTGADDIATDRYASLAARAEVLRDQINTLTGTLVNDVASQRPTEANNGESI